MEIVEKGGGCSVRDLPPSKRFSFVGSQLGSDPIVPLPAKKRGFPPFQAAAAVVPVCLPAKKRAYAPTPVEEDAVKVCLPAKKRTYVPPAFLPAKKRVHAPVLPQDAAVPPSIPAKKRVHTPVPPQDAAVPLSVPAKKRVHAPVPPQDADVPLSIPAKKRAHAPVPPQDASGPLYTTAKKRVNPLPPLPEDAASWPPIPAKKRSQAPSPREDVHALFPVCLQANKRVMPPFIPRSPSSHVARVAAVKEARPQGPPNKRGGTTNSRAANGDGECTATEVSKMPSKPKEAKEQESMKLSIASTAEEPRDLQCKQPCNGKRSEVQPEVIKKLDESTDVEEKSPAREEEPLNEGEEVARELKEAAVEEEDDGVLCAVCGSTDGDPSDPIVFCDGCDLMVHASCYGDPLAQSIPDGDWFCSLCSAKASATTATLKKGKPSRPRCCLCPARGGAMKRTTDGEWAHIACALLVPEVFFHDPDGREGVDCSRVPGHRFTKECYICEGSRGCALECSQPKCGLGFHVTCGLGGGLCIEYREEKGGAVVAGFCRDHTKLWEKQQLTGKYKIVPRGHE